MRTTSYHSLTFSKCSSTKSMMSSAVMLSMSSSTLSNWSEICWMTSATFRNSSAWSMKRSTCRVNSRASFRMRMKFLTRSVHMATSLSTLSK